MKRNNKCADCVEYKRCKETTTSLIFFIIGLIAVIAVRAVTILEHVKPVYGKMAWYVGVLGFFLYFAYKYKVDNDRSHIISSRNLKSKVLHGGEIDKEDRDAIGAVLCALGSKKDRVNYLIIFISSAIVLVIAAYLDLLKK